MKSKVEEDDDGEDEDGDALVRVGSMEYLSGFLTSPILRVDVGGETARRTGKGGGGGKSGGRGRGSGLEQAVKLGGYASAVLIILFLGFMASNGLM
jgi:hypothetical protein